MHANTNIFVPGLLLTTMFVGEIPVTVYIPSNASDDPTIWVYFHGGGMVLGSRKTCETACQIVAM